VQEEVVVEIYITQSLCIEIIKEKMLDTHNVNLPDDQDPKVWNFLMLRNVNECYIKLSTPKSPSYKTS
jgi:hypothetical protein